MRNLLLSIILILCLSNCQENKPLLQNKNVTEVEEQPNIEDTIKITDERSTDLNTPEIAEEILIEEHTFLQEQKYFTLNSEPEDVNTWILERVKKANDGKAELVQIPLSYVDVGYEDFNLHLIPMPGENPDPLWIDPILITHTQVDLSNNIHHYVTGYFTGEMGYKLQNKEEKGYKACSFKIIAVDHMYDNAHIIQPKILADKIYTDLQTLSNIEMILFKLIFDGKKYTQIYPDLPKAQKALLHNDSDIKVFFKGQDLAPEVTPQSYMADYLIDSQFIENGKYKLNPDENWLYMEEYIPQDSVYIVLKKWFREDDTTFTIRMDVKNDQLEQAYQILEDFSPQIIPEFY